MSAEKRLVTFHMRSGPPITCNLVPEIVDKQYEHAIRTNSVVGLRVDQPGGEPLLTMQAREIAWIDYRDPATE